MSQISSQLGPEGPEKFDPTSALEDAVSTLDPDKSSAKGNNNQPYLDIPLQTAFARSTDTISNISTYSADNENERRTGRLLNVSAGNRLPSRSPAPPLPTTWRGKAQAAWSSNKGLALVMLAQLFGVMMNVTTRLLEMNGSHGAGMHPFQV